jgi:putative ABC transport system permease protein
MKFKLTQDLPIYRHALTFALKRLVTKRWLALSLVLGMLVSAALATAIPVYSDGINASILWDSLAKGAGHRQAFDFVFRYVGSWNGAVDEDQYQPVNQYLSEQASSKIGLPQLEQTRYLATAYLQLYPAGEDFVTRNRLDRVKLAYLTDVSEHIQLIEGTTPASAVEPGQVEVLAALDLANALDLRVGDIYTLYLPDNGDGLVYRQDFLISGLWIPDDPESDFWALYSAESFEKKLLVTEESWWAATADLLRPVDEAAWRLTLDGSKVTSGKVPGLLARTAQVQNQTSALLPDTELESSPVPALRQFRSKSQALTGSLFAFSAPVLGLVLFFLSLAAGLFVRNQQNEIAVLRSRGASRLWILVVYIIEWGSLGLAAWVLGLPVGMVLAGLMGRTQSFLDFSNATAFSPHLSMQAVFFGLLAVIVGIIFCLIPVWQFGRYTIISYKQERARSQERPFWQRFYLDLACLLPALYGWYTLYTKGRLSVLGRTVGSTNPFQNPLLFLLPSLFLLGSGLLLIRLLPLFLNFVASITSRLSGVSFPYIIRHFARSGHAYQGVLLLTVCTVGLAVFVASEARSLDQSTHDSIYYSVGADLNLAEGGEFIPDEDSVDSDSGLWNFLPIADHLNIPGVEAAARVGRYDASVTLSGSSVNGQVLGVDRSDFAQVAFFRDDFANESFISLINRLAARPDAVLVDETTWEKFGLNTGDTLPVDFELQGVTFELSFTVVGVFTRFPTWSPGYDGALFVMNLENIFESIGAIQPYDVWLKTQADANTADIINGINQMGVVVITTQDARAQYEQILEEPGRQGVLGMLSIGFLASAGLALVLLLLYILFSFRERSIQLGVLRAIGMNVRQMRQIMAGELAFLIVCSLVIGTLIGALAVALYVPYLPIETGTGVDALPLISQVSWLAVGQIVLLFSIAFGLGTYLLITVQRRMNLYQAIKMGETV